MMAVRLRAVVALAVLVAFVSIGCSSKKKGAGAGGPGGMEEQGLGGGDSLAKYKAGTLGGGEGGPLKDVHFAFDSYELDEQGRAALRDNASWLKDHTRSKIEIEGHCDERGTVEYNLALGTKRAGAAKEYLATLGIAADRLTTISYGEELPLCHEHDESCWQKNRRDHFVVLGE
jgi:peptidoglycan-associated lipoprotein